MQYSTKRYSMKLLSISLVGAIAVAAITPHEIAMFTPGMTATPTPITAESTDKDTYQLPARPFTPIPRST